MNGTKNITLVKPCLKDLKILLRWANEQYFQGLKINTFNKINEKEHLSWFLKKIDKKDCYFKIVLFNNYKIGQIKLEKITEFYEIDIFISKSYRGNNIASTILDLAIKDINKGGEKKFLAKVKNNNYVSLNFFKKFGFSVYKTKKNYLELIY